MSSSDTTRFSRLSRSLALAARIGAARFPATAILIVLISLVANLAERRRFVVAEDDTPWLMAALFAAAAAAVLVRLLAESRDWRPAIQVTVPSVAAAMVCVAVWFARDVGLFAPPLIVAITTAIPLAPYIGRPDDRRFWAFTLWATVGVTLALISVLLFTLGLSAIMAMISFLFNVDIAGSVYEHIYITALTLVGPLFALGRIPPGFDETVAVDAEDRLAQGLRFLFDWIAAPLALLTAVILHLYAAKILILGEVPKNEIGWIVTFYAALVLSFRLVVGPFIDDGAVTMRVFERAWAPMLVVPTALLVYAASLRIASQGFTIERYYLALDALTITLVILVQTVRPLRGDIRLISGIPLLLLALSSCGPWGVAGTVGRSQAELLRLDLQSGRRDAAGDPDVVAPFLYSRADALYGIDLSAGRSVVYSRIGALDDVGELERVLPLLSGQQRATVAAAWNGEEGDLRPAIDEALGLSRGAGQAPTETYVAFKADKHAALDLTGFDVGLGEHDIDSSLPRADRMAAEDDAGVFGLEGSDLVLRFMGTEDRFSLEPAMDAMPLDGAAASAPIVVDLRSANGRQARVSVSAATLVIGSGQHPSSVTLTMLLRRADWPIPPSASLGGKVRNGPADIQPGGTVGERPR